MLAIATGRKGTNRMAAEPPRRVVWTRVPGCFATAWFRVRVADHCMLAGGKIETVRVAALNRLSARMGDQRLPAHRRRARRRRLRAFRDRCTTRCASAYSELVAESLGEHIFECWSEGFALDDQRAITLAIALTRPAHLWSPQLSDRR